MAGIDMPCHTLPLSPRCHSTIAYFMPLIIYLPYLNQKILVDLSFKEKKQISIEGKDKKADINYNIALFCTW